MRERYKEFFHEIKKPLAVIIGDPDAPQTLIISGELKKAGYRLNILPDSEGLNLSYLERAVRIIKLVDSS